MGGFQLWKSLYSMNHILGSVLKPSILGNRQNISQYVLFIYFRLQSIGVIYTLGSLRYATQWPFRQFLKLLGHYFTYAWAPGHESQPLGPNHDSFSFYAQISQDTTKESVFGTSSQALVAATCVVLGLDCGWFHVGSSYLPGCLFL